MNIFDDTILSMNSSLFSIVLIYNFAQY